MDDHKNGRKFLVTRAKEVEFIFHSPNALKVFLAGDFNSWEAKSLPMQKYKEDLWEAMVNLPPGRYEYKMLVDNAWAEEPPCTVMIRGSCFKLILDGGRIPNPFGTQNYFFLVK